MSALQQLLQLVPPPVAPVAARGDWAAVERALGTSLPTDWKQLIEAYGYGTFCDFFNLLSPFFEPCPMASQANEILAADRELAEMLPDAVPFGLFPEADGALPWARTDNGDVAYWLTIGAPDDWPIAIWRARGGARFELVDGGAVRFLHQWSSGAAACPLFPKDLDFKGKGADAVWFDPWMERVHQTLTLATVTDPPEDLEGATYAWRLRALLDAMQPVTMRGAYGDEDDESRQVHFLAGNGALRLTYDTLYGHNLRFAAPAAQIDSARARLDEAIRAMGCQVTGVTTG